MSRYDVSSPTQSVPAVGEIPRAAKEDFENAVNVGQQFVLIDARGGPAYQSSHLDLKGALRVDPSNAGARLDQLSIPQGAAIFVVCT